MKVRDRRFIERSIDCPECAGKFTITVKGGDGLTVQSAGPDQKSSTAGRKASNVAIFARMKTPRFIAWAVAMILAGVLLLPSGQSPRMREQNPSHKSESAQVAGHVGQTEGFPAASPHRPLGGDANGDERPSVSADESHSEDSAAAGDEAGPPTAMALPETTELRESKQPGATDFADERVELAETEENTARSDDEPSENFDTAEPDGEDAAAAMSPDETAAEISAAEDPGLATVDVEQAMAVPIISFDQTTPVSVRRLMQQWEEMSQMSVNYDESVGLGHLGQEISFRLYRTTVQGILDRVCAEAGLEYEIQDQAVVVRHPNVTGGAVTDSNGSG